MSSNTIAHKGRTVLTGLTATGNSQATAFTLLNSADHQISTVAAGTGFILPVAKLSSSVRVFNGGASALSVYPPVGGTVNGGSVNAAVPLAAGAGIEFFAADLGTWYATSSGGGAVPTTGLTITQDYQAIVAPADGATVTFDLSAANLFVPAALGGNRTLAVSNSPTVSPWAKFTIVLTQDGTGSRTVTWFSGIRWAGGSAPTLTATASKSDVFAFVQIASGSYLGFIVGQNL